MKKHYYIARNIKTNKLELLIGTCLPAYEYFGFTHFDVKQCKSKKQAIYLIKKESEG